MFFIFSTAIRFSSRFVPYEVHSNCSTSLPGGRAAPPFMFTGYAKGNVSTNNVENVADIIGANSIVRNKAALLYVHYAVAEYCDVDGNGEYNGDWPPQTADKVLRNILSLVPKALFFSDAARCCGVGHNEIGERCVFAG